ncbi:biosynthetic peptidoglycan transglycosylase [Mesonia maritima]|uniref:Penicillin-binding protein 1A n=1 Tax=Mesonia maritima TaxID=1793873 RepID=A0ABU1K5P7_9FLAO|nr:biosynthetic peptidoglycan transglycosylase [Mesonia maritima]MDR6300621.1 penicillin-binding protein 1A [Mesonia maritima]
MKSENKEQYYPTYNSENRDILLIEFEEAQKIANGQTKVYGQVTNILLAVSTFGFTFLFKKVDEMNLSFQNSIFVIIVLFLFGAILLRYFVDLQKQITINARKAVTLRKMLGLDYGSIELTLPNWRVEGASNPFVIKYFNGWLNFRSMPFWLLTITINSIWWLATKNQSNYNLEILNGNFQINWWLGNLFFSLVYIIVFRKNLYDRHESLYLSFVKKISFILRVKLLSNFEFILYRAKLSYIELERLNISIKNLKEILVDIEDKDFYTNKGISFKSIIRGALSRFSIFRKKYNLISNGGSTITMQLARTLFIPANQNKYRRKIIEILLSFWLNQQFKKDEILKIYISSVRFERGILGISQASKYFFGELKTPSNEEAFFLIERLSNISSTVNWDRIKYLSKITSINLDNKKLKEIYKGQINQKKIREIK